MFDYSFREAPEGEPRRFTAGQIESWNTNGFIAPVRMYEGETLSRIQEYFDRREHEWKRVGGFQAFHHVDAGQYDLATDPVTVEYIQDLIGPDVGCHTSSYINKPAGDPKVVHWHQDITFNPMDAGCALIWMAVHDVDPENGGLWVIPGEHRNGVLPWDPKVGHRILEPPNEANKIPVPLKAGEAVFFSDLLPHWSGPNTTDRPRGGMNFTYASIHTPIRTGKNKWCVVCTGSGGDDSWVHNARPDGESPLR